MWIKKARINYMYCPEEIILNKMAQYVEVNQLKRYIPCKLYQKESQIDYTNNIFNLRISNVTKIKRALHSDNFQREDITALNMYVFKHEAKKNPKKQ